MDEEEGGGIRLSKRFSDKGGEVDYKTTAGTAWSHSYLNQKPWHPLSYPNQRRKWIAEQTHAQRERRADEVAREYAQEQEFFRQTALVSKKEKEKMEMMKAVSFMYVRPPGYNAESAKAADVADERKKQEQEQESTSCVPSENEYSILMKLEAVPSAEEKRKPRPKDVFGRAVPTEEQFEVLKNAPRLETGVAARSKPFGVEIRNVKCLRCGNYGHQSGDRECPLKDVIMPSEESRLKRDDPLMAILAQTDVTEPLKWELKQKPGLSPPRGGFRADDPNQQIVAEDIFDEYGGFLGGDSIPELLSNFYSSNPKKSSRRRKHKSKLSPSSAEVNDQEKGSTSSDDGGRRMKKKRDKKLISKHLHSSLPQNSDFDKKHDAKVNNRSSAGGDRGSRLKKKRHDKKSRRLSKSSSRDSGMQYDSEDNRSLSGDDRERRSSNKERHKRRSRRYAYSSQSDSDCDRHHRRSSDDDRERRLSNKERHKRKSRKHSYSSESDYSDYDRARHKRSIRYKHSHHKKSDNSDSEGHYRKKNYHRRHH